MYKVSTKGKTKIVSNMFNKYVEYGLYWDDY